jgi:hypothetical protein
MKHSQKYKKDKKKLFFSKFFFAFKKMAATQNHIPYLNSISNKIIFLGSTIIAIVGIVSNTLNIVICLRKELRSSLLSYYNILISIFNILTFVATLCFYFPITLGFESLVTLSDISCATLSFALRVVIQMSIWINVGVTIDRFLCVSFPSKFKFNTDRKKLSWIFFGVFIVLLLLNIPNLFFKINQNGGSLVCSSTNSLIVLIRNLEIGLFRAVLPAILHIVLSAILIRDLFKTRRSVQTNQDDKRERRFTRIVIALNVFFCLTELPSSILTIYIGIIGFTPTNPIPEKLSYSLALTTIVYQAAIVLSGFTFNSLLFVNLMFNRIFQRELGKILCFSKSDDASRTSRLV